VIKLRIVTLSLICALFVAVGAAATSAADNAPLSLRLNWKMKGEFTPFVVAAEKGFFAAEGLDVTVNEGSGATQALQTVASGQDDIAYVPSIQLTIDQGDKPGHAGKGGRDRGQDRSDGHGRQVAYQAVLSRRP
jgi:ABC-type nitrate/sulfonate/bicarbonate transport system substrate-binding protein